MNYVFKLILLSLLCCPLALAEESPVTVYAIALDYRLNEGGTTQYNALLTALAAQGLAFETIIRPLRRSQVNFKRDKKSCIFPATINAITMNDTSISVEQLISSSPIDRVSLRVFTQPDKPVITNMEDLDTKKLALLNGVNPDIFFPNINVEIEHTANEEVRVKMLNAGRIDAILGFLPDVLLAAQDHGLPVPHYSPGLFIVADEKAAFICHDTRAAKDFIAKANQLIKMFKNNGKLKQILGPHADIVPVTR